MATEVMEKPLQYLDKAVGAIRELGIWPEASGEQPITGLLNEITALDENKVILIGRTLTQASAFNEVVRSQVAAMNVGNRYEEITNGFNSIRDDAKGMVDQLEDGKLDLMERVGNVWMKVSRGDIAARFNKIRDVYLDVSKETKNQIDREHIILEAYRDFRGALKQAEVMALELLDIATNELDSKKTALQAAADALTAFTEGTPADRARLEMTRDEKLRDLQNEERRYQIAKDLSRQPHDLVLDVRSDHGAPDADDQRQGARLPAVGVVLFDQRDRVHGALGLVHRPLRPPRIDRDAQRDEGGRVEVARDARRDRRQGAGRSAEGRLRPDHPLRRGQEARRLASSTSRRSRASSSTRCACRRPRTPPKSATRSRTARSASRSLPPTATPCCSRPRRTRQTQ